MTNRTTAIPTSALTAMEFEVVYHETVKRA